MWWKKWSPPNMPLKEQEVNGHFGASGNSTLFFSGGETLFVLFILAVGNFKLLVFSAPLPETPSKPLKKTSLNPNLNEARIVQGGKTFSTPLFDNGLYCRWVWNLKKQKKDRKNPVEEWPKNHCLLAVYRGKITTQIYDIYIYIYFLYIWIVNHDKPW